MELQMRRVQDVVKARSRVFWVWMKNVKVEDSARKQVQQQMKERRNVRKDADEYENQTTET